MSASEILNELPRLSPAELETIYRRAAELHQAIEIEPSPELLSAIDEADESFSKEGGVTIGEAHRIAESWNTK